MSKVVPIVLLVLWAVGVATGHTLGGFIHALLVLALLLWLIQMTRG